MAESLRSFSSRVLLIPNYSAPLFTHVIDADKNIFNKPFETILRDILLVPDRRIVTNQKWNFIATLASEILTDEDFWERATKKETGDSGFWRRQLKDFLDYYRAETSRHIMRLREDPSFFAFQALSRLVYQASKGFGPDYDYGVSASLPLPRFSAILNDEL